LTVDPLVTYVVSGHRVWHARW